MTDTEKENGLLPPRPGEPKKSELIENKDKCIFVYINGVPVSFTIIEGLGLIAQITRRPRA